MALSTNVYPKKSQDVLEAEDWNEGFGEIGALDTGKLGRAGGVVGGPLTAPTVTVEALTVRRSATFPAGYVTPAGLGMARSTFTMRMRRGAVGVLWIEAYPPGAPPRIPGFCSITGVSSGDGLQPNAIAALPFGGAYDCIKDAAGATLIRRGLLFSVESSSDPSVSKSPVVTVVLFTMADPTPVLQYEPTFQGFGPP